ncbi:MAG TPA: nucleoside monophosphate kinase [Acidimicrobiales bacterium]|nr:nucleoside monophosphate kinase [Acidimicrobiales bacterium]
MTRGLRLLIIGKQGSGKGTLCAGFSRHFEIPHIATGDALRAAVARKTAVGLEAKSYMDVGKLVPDELVMRIVDELFEEGDLRNSGFLFDGFPRTIHQADLLDVLLAPEGIDAVIDLEVETDIVVGRLSSRRVCTNPECGAIYSLSEPPKVRWTCDLCGSPVRQREDDRVEMILQRLADYENLTAPLISRYERAGRLITVDAKGTPDEVFATALGGLVAREITPDVPQAFPK